MLYPDSDPTANQLATLCYTELFILQGVGFRFPTQLRGTGMGWESESELESASVNANSPPMIFYCFSYLVELRLNRLQLRLNP